MSTFYGTVSGMARTEATRRGSRTSGITSSAQSYDGSVITRLGYVENDDTLKDELIISISLSDTSSSGWGTGYFYGTLEELKECFTMYKNYINEKYEMRRGDSLFLTFDTDENRKEIQF